MLLLTKIDFIVIYFYELATHQHFVFWGIFTYIVTGNGKYVCTHNDTKYACCF